jgi:hypothetical protein
MSTLTSVSWLYVSAGGYNTLAQVVAISEHHGVIVFTYQSHQSKYFLESGHQSRDYFCPASQRVKEVCSHGC